ENRDTTSVQQTLRPPRPKNAQAILSAKRPGAVTQNAVSPARIIHSVLTGEVGSHHRTIETNKASLVVQPDMERGVIAVANKGFGIETNQPSTKERQQPSQTQTAANTDNAIDRWIGKRGMKILQSIFNRARIVKRAIIKSVFPKNSLKPERVQMGDAT